MAQKLTGTMHASAERIDLETIKRQNLVFRNNVTLVDVTNSVSQMLVILNKQRQIVYANNQFRRLLKMDDDRNILGKRVGEAFNCVHSNQTKGGCGTTEFCRKCGAINAMLESQEVIQSEKECSIAENNNDALNLRVMATPYKVGDEEFTIFIMTDISHEKRRQILERIFFHDVLNSAGGISGLSEILSEIEDPDQVAKISQMIHRTSNNLIDEIISQRELSEAERGDLALKITEINSGELLKQVAESYSRHEITAGKFISIAGNSENFILETDKGLLSRILGNMLKNALEASMPGKKVTLSSLEKKNGFVFRVNNSTFIDREIQLQLFKRSFTTKGPGRGIGTYSMKLLGEKYLKGKIGFESNQQEGTTFFIELPKNKY